MSDLNQTAGVFRDPTRPLHTKGGPPGTSRNPWPQRQNPLRELLPTEP